MPEHIYITRQGDKIQATQVGIMIDELQLHGASGFFGDSNDNSEQFTFVNPGAGNTQGNAIGQWLQPWSDAFFYAGRLNGRSAYIPAFGNAASRPMVAFSPCREWTLTATFLGGIDRVQPAPPNNVAPLFRDPTVVWNEVFQFPDIAIAIGDNFQPGNTWTDPAAIKIGYAACKHELSAFLDSGNNNTYQEIGCFRKAGHHNIEGQDQYPNSVTAHGSMVGPIPIRPFNANEVRWEVEIETTLRWIPLGNLTGRLECLSRFTSIENGQMVTLPMASSGQVCNHMANCKMSVLLTNTYWLEQLTVN